jgi:integrase/recombinase XerD
LTIAYACGLRVSEVIKIKLCDFELERGMLKIRGKGEKDRYVPIGAIPIGMLSAQMADKSKDDYLFNRQYSKEHLSKRTAELILDHACIKSGIETDHYFHMLRHAFATHSLERGTGIYDVQKLLGHSNVKTTAVYLHVSNAYLAKNTGPLADILADVG